MSSYINQRTVRGHVVVVGGVFFPVFVLDT